ncbi:unnamed protein product [Adineta ricciae]|uniref:F-box domain-containing protein n=1 Tax=Adineta ricciae TaxID=249248 RepID=A0A814AKB5_ADIRI|nr:unnamed protein product [Adineta ricciae]
MLTYFDHLPVEILHMVFQYMSNSDVFYSFDALSPYINAVLNEYCSRTIDLRCISKSRFDFICNHLDLSRIISLTLSNDDHTPQQVQLFFTRFRLEDFLNLQSLTLLSITNEEIRLILSDLSKLRHLSSLLTTSRSAEPLLLGQTLTHMFALKNLSIPYGDIFDHNVAFPLHGLNVLDAGICNFLELRRLQRIVPSLVSLKIILKANHQLQLLADVNIWAQLERLDLTLQNKMTTRFDEIDGLLRRFGNLKHLSLNIRGSSNELANGTRWETCPTIVSLTKFAFSFEFVPSLVDSPERIHDIFVSFCSYFWREFKKWYVIVTVDKIYTITSFDNHEFLECSCPPLSTAPNDQWFYSKVKRIKLDKQIPFNNLNLFSKLEILDVPNESTLSLLLNVNQFAYLRHLILRQSFLNETAQIFLTRNSHIDRLTLLQFDYTELFVFPTIRYLYLEESIRILTRTQIKILSRTFPSLTSLVIHLNDFQLVYTIIDRFLHLQNGIFHFYKLTKPISQQSLKQHTHLEYTASSFICRTESKKFVLWINNSNLPRELTKPIEMINSIAEQRSDKCLLQ